MRLFQEFLAFKRAQQGQEQRQPTNAELWDRWYPTVEDTGRAPNIRNHRRYTLETPFVLDGEETTLGQRTPAECPPEALEAWRAQLRRLRNIRDKPLAPDYRDQIRLTLQAMWRYHVDVGTIPRNPLKGIPREDGWRGRARVGYPTREWLEEYTRHCRRVVSDMIWLSFEAGGLRRTEMRLLRIDEYDREQGALILNEERNKNGEARAVILNDAARAIVERNVAISRSEFVFDHPNKPRGGAIPDTTLDQWVRNDRATAKAAGVNVRLAGDAFSLHLARHGFVMRMQGEAPEAWIADQVGHRSTEQIAKRYGRLRGPQAREDMRRRLEAPAKSPAPPAVAMSDRRPAQKAPLSRQLRKNRAS